MLSDNAKTFKSMAKEVKRLLRCLRLYEHFTNQGVKWRFIVDLSPCQGGTWERLVRSVKRCVIKIIGRAMISYLKCVPFLLK